MTISLCDALTDSIRERLFKGEFAPNVPLDKDALAAHYGVGHLPIAQALAQLARERLLAAQPQGGYCVGEYSRADVETLRDAFERLRPVMDLPPFAVAARSLYHHLRLSSGPLS